MKKILALILTVAALVGLCSCNKNKYEPVPSTEEESRTVMTLTVDGERYDVKYELYRALFIGNREKVDLGDTTVWQGESKDEYIAAINDVIASRAAEIYSALHVAHKLGIDLYTSQIDNQISEYVKLAVEGNGINVTGHGTYEKYLDHLAAMGINYAVSDLLLRYSIALDLIYDCYVGEENVFGEQKGILKYDDDDLLEFYEGDESVRVLKAYFQSGVRTENQMKSFRNGLAAQNLNIDKALYIIQNTLATSSELIDAEGNVSGVIIGKYALDELYYEEYTESAFALGDGEVSSLIEIRGVGDNYSDGFYVLVGVAKDSAYFESHKEIIAEAYVNNAIGKVLHESKQVMIESVQIANDYSSINHSDFIK